MAITYVDEKTRQVQSCVALVYATPAQLTDFLLEPSSREFGQPKLKLKYVKRLRRHIPIPPPTNIQAATAAV